MTPNPFLLDAPAIERLLKPGRPAFPELEAARTDVAALRDFPHVHALLAPTTAALNEGAAPPLTRYTDYRRYIADGDRRSYEDPYFHKRRLLAAAAVRTFLGEPLLPLVNDYLWSICEESNWVLPAHERARIDLFAAETAFNLADVLHLLGSTLNEEVRSRVRTELERRIFDPYLRFHSLEWWYTGENNWNGVCNSSVAAAFVLVEPEPARVARALAIAFAGLDHFLNVAFETDGGSNEGVAYWHYGLFNLIALAELLYARSNGALNLLADERLQQIAGYPAKMQLSGAHFASFSDCDETLTFHPGFITRFAERSGERTLGNLINQHTTPLEDWRLTMLLRNILWWDGAPPAAQSLGDTTLPVCGTARLVGRAPGGAPVVAAIKAGHNAENHNQNDIGSFIVHIDGETLLADPGRGLYNRFYFGPQRYENIFANSYGHSVPRIGGLLQPPGHEYQGTLIGATRDDQGATATIEFAAAYPVPSLSGLRRELALRTDGAIIMTDSFSYTGTAPEIEEAFVTWCDTTTDGAHAIVRGARHTLTLTIEEPAGATFALEALEEQSVANHKPDVLKRLSVALPQGAERFVVRMVPAAVKD